MLHWKLWWGRELDLTSSNGALQVAYATLQDCEAHAQYCCPICNTHDSDMIVATTWNRKTPSLLEHCNFFPIVIDQGCRRFDCDTAPFELSLINDFYGQFCFLMFKSENLEILSRARGRSTV